MNLRTEPYWMDLPYGVRLKVKPLTTSTWNAASAWATREMLKVIKIQEELKAVGKKDTDLPDLLTDENRRDYLETMIMKGCAVACIVEWDNIEDPVEDGKLCPLTTDNITRFVEDFRMGNAFWTKITSDYEKLLNEGNGSSLAQNGTSEEGTLIAEGVETEEMPVQEEKQ